MINLTMDTIRTCPYTALIVNTENTRHVHEFWEITYTVSGKLTNIVNERPITCDPFTQFLIMKPGDIHEIQVVHLDHCLLFTKSSPITAFLRPTRGNFITAIFT